MILNNNTTIIVTGGFDNSSPESTPGPRMSYVLYVWLMKESDKLMAVRVHVAYSIITIIIIAACEMYDARVGGKRAK